MSALTDSLIEKPLRAPRHGDRSPASIGFLLALWFALAFSVLCLTVLLVDSFMDGMTRLDTSLFTEYSSRIRPESAGARAAILGSAWVIALTALMAVPLGVAAGVYLEEFADNKRWYNKLIEVNLTNLAAVDFGDPLLSVLPIRLAGADGAPVRAVAVELAP